MTVDSWRGVASEEKEDEVTGKVSAMLRRRNRAVLVSVLRPYRKQLLWTMAAKVVSTAAWLATPYLIGLVIDKGIEAKDQRQLFIIVGVMLASMAVESTMWATFLWWSGKLSQKILLDLKSRLFRKFQQLSVSFYEDYTSGRVVARQTSDIESITELLNVGLDQLTTSLMLLFGVGAWLLFLDLRLAAVVLLSFPLVLAATWWFRKHSETAYRAVRNAVALVIVHYNESLGGIRAVQAFRREPRNQEIFEDVDSRYRDANLWSVKLAATFGPGIHFLGRLTTAVVLLYGGYLVTHDQMTIGKLTAFLLYLERFFGPLQDLSQFYNIFQAASAALEKLGGVFEEEPAVREPASPVMPTEVSGSISFEGVEFSYREDRPVLRGLDLQVPAGETVALVGETGAGKSTIARLIARFYDPTSGRVLLDGIDLRDLSEDTLRHSIIVVTQESFLFSGTVADNIAFGRPGATAEEIEEACKAIGADEFISMLPEGYDTEVKRRGVRLSSGQRQLIAFARAFLADPRVLILDEATSSLDLPTERLVQHALRTLLSDRTAFIIAHRLSTVEIADRVLVVSDGRIVEDGTPAELIVGGGAYSELHREWIESLAS